MDPRSHFLNSLLRLFLVLCGVWLLTLSPQSQTVLYEANFDADAGSSGTAGASPDAWTASVIRWREQYSRMANECRRFLFPTRRSRGFLCLGKFSRFRLQMHLSFSLAFMVRNSEVSWTALISVIGFEQWFGSLDSTGHASKRVGSTLYSDSRCCVLCCNSN